MTFKLGNGVSETTVTTGTTTPLALTGAVTTPRNKTFLDGIGDGNTTIYKALSSDGITWEIGVGVVGGSGTTLTRATILDTNAGGSSPVTLAAPSIVSCVIPADVLFLLSELLSPDDQQVIMYDAGLGRFAAAYAGGVSWHEAVALATASALPANTYNNGTAGVGATLTGNSDGALSIDGVVTTVGYRVLVKNEAAAANNGIYIVTQIGDGSHPYILTRATDADNMSDIEQADTVAVGVAGAINGRTIWISTLESPFTAVGTSTINWSLIIGGGGGTVTTQANTGFTSSANLGGLATVSDDTNGMCISQPASNGSTENWRILTQAAPSPPFTVTARFALGSNFANTAYIIGGLGFYDGTKLQLIGMNIGTINPTSPLGSLELADYSTVSTSSAQTIVGSPYPNPLWVQIENDGTDAYFRTSVDGIHWSTMKTVTISGGFLSNYADMIFIGIDPYDSTQATLTLLDFDITT